MVIRKRKRSDVGEQSNGGKELFEVIKKNKKKAGKNR
jgi:hypothetical protein